MRRICPCDLDGICPMMPSTAATVNTGVPKNSKNPITPNTKKRKKKI